MVSRVRIATTSIKQLAQMKEKRVAPAGTKTAMALATRANALTPPPSELPPARHAAPPNRPQGPQCAFRLLPLSFSPLALDTHSSTFLQLNSSLFLAQLTPSRTSPGYSNNPAPRTLISSYHVSTRHVPLPRPPPTALPTDPRPTLHFTGDPPSLSPRPRAPRSRRSSPRTCPPRLRGPPPPVAPRRFSLS